MPEKIKDVRPPRGLSRRLYRSMILLYRLGLGGLMGDHFLLLNHTGRKTGRRRQAVLEVVQHNHATGVYVIAAGFGEKSDWYQNIMAHPQVTIQVRNRRMSVCAERLPLPEATAALLEYAQRHPNLLNNLASVLGYRTDGSEADVRFFASVMPMVALIPLEKQ